MKCLNCHVPLAIAERHEIEIDYCPQCRGVWLDRGELDKIIDRATKIETKGRLGATQFEESERDEPAREPRKRRRESFLGELFDF